MAFAQTSHSSVNHRIPVAAVFLAAPLIAIAGIKTGVLQKTATAPIWYLLLAAPFWEEFFFRGGVQRLLTWYPWGRKQFMRLSWGNWTTSLFFVAVHLPFQGMAAVAILLPSLVLGWLFDRYGRILLCMLLHIWFNLSLFLAGHRM